MKRNYFALISLFIILMISCSNQSISDWYTDQITQAYDSWYDITEMYHAGELDIEKLSEQIIVFKKCFQKQFVEDIPFSSEERGTIIQNINNISEILEETNRLINGKTLEQSEVDFLIASIDSKMFIIENWTLWHEVRRNIKFTNFYYLIIFTCILTVSILIFLNNRQLQKKEKEIYDSKENLKYIIKAQEEERSRISRELHDSLAQDIRYIGLLATKIPDNSIAQSIQNKQSECINKIRNLCYNFVPPDIAAGDLESALKTLIDSFSKETEIEYRLTIIDGIDFSLFTTDELMHFYRIVQEALLNIIKHSEASEATVLLRQEKTNSGNSIYKLIISDDGCGIDNKLLKYINNQRLSIKKEDGSHFGLQSMKERVSLLGGSIYFESIPGDGTQILISIDK